MQQNGTLTSLIVNEVSEVKGVDVLQLEPPLQQVVDAEALESLFSPAIDGSPREDIRLEFTYADCRITIEHTGEVQLSVEECTAK